MPLNRRTRALASGSASASAPFRRSRSSSSWCTRVSRSSSTRNVGSISRRRACSRRRSAQKPWIVPTEASSISQRSSSPRSEASISLRSFLFRSYAAFSVNVIAAIWSNRQGDSQGANAVGGSPRSPASRPSNQRILPTTVVVFPVPALAASNTSPLAVTAAACSSVQWTVRIPIA